MNIQVKIERDAIDYAGLYHKQHTMLQHKFNLAAETFNGHQAELIRIAHVKELEPVSEPENERKPVIEVVRIPVWINKELHIPHYSAIHIIDYVCKKYGVSKLDLVSDRRTMDLIIPRHEAMFKLQHHTALSMPQIGRLLGNRDHSTVMKALSKFQIRLDNNDSKLIPDPDHWIDGLQMHRVFVGQGDGI